MVQSSRRALTMWVDARRRFPRVKAPVLLRSPTPVPVSAVHSAGAFDLGGLRVRCPQPLRVNEEHTMVLELPSGRQLSCRVRVAWSGSGRTGDLEAGLQILGADRNLGEVWQVLEELAEPDVVDAGG